VTETAGFVTKAAGLRDNHVTALMGFVTQRPEFVTQALVYVTIT